MFFGVINVVRQRGFLFLEEADLVLQLADLIGVDFLEALLQRVQFVLQLQLLRLLPVT